MTDVEDQPADDLHLRRPLNRLGTILASVVVAGCVAVFAYFTLTTPPLELLAAPNRTSIHVIERGLDLTAAGRDLPGWMRWIADLDDSAEESYALAREAYDEVLDAGLEEPGDTPLLVVQEHRDRIGYPRDVSQPLRTRLLVLTTVVLALVAAGVVVLLVWLARGRRWPVIGEALVPPPWSIGDGYSVAVCAVVLAILVLVAVIWVPVLELWGTLFASLGMVWLMRRFLARPRDLGFLSTLGLGVPRGARAFVLFVLAAFAVDLVGGTAIAWAAEEWFGATYHWTEWILEDLLFDPPGRVVLASIDGMVWAPLFEEIGFRGLVYATLRTRLRVAPAVLASAVLFSVIHFYSWPGFFAVAWSGAVWAVLYEKTRSLWPCVACHAVGNLLAVGGPLLLYR